MKPLPFAAFLLLLSFALLLHLRATPTETSATPPLLTREMAFDSLDAFITTVRSFRPDTSTNYMAWQFAALELGQIGDPSARRPLRPAAIETCSTLWNNDNTAVILATARPPTEATHSQVALLFLLMQEDKKWYITDIKQFTAYGKNCSVEAQLTSVADGGGLTLTPDLVVITITKHGGGQHLGSDCSASYRISNTQWDLIPLS